MEEDSKLAGYKNMIDEIKEDARRIEARISRDPSEYDLLPS